MVQKSPISEWCDNLMLCISCLEQMDFLSVHIDYNCAISSEFENELRNLQVQ